MNNFKTVTNEKRESAKEKILEIISSEFKENSISIIFVITLFKEIVSDLESKALNQKFKDLNSNQIENK